MRNSMYAEKSIKDLMNRFLSKGSAGDLLGSRGGSHPATINEVNLSAQGCIIGGNDLGYQKEEKKFNMERGCTTMKRMMIALVLVLSIAGLTFAATSDTTLVKVACNCTLDLTISEDSYDFGTLATAASSITTDPLTLNNASAAGAASIEYVKIKISDEDDLNQWTTSTAAGLEQYVLQAMFSPTTSAPASGDFAADDVLTTADQTWDSATGETFNGANNKEYLSDSYTGSNASNCRRGRLVSTNVNAGFTRRLYLRLQTPLAVVSSEQHSITLMATGSPTE